MGLLYESLNAETRALMLKEFNSDISNGNIYLSKRFNENGAKYFIELMTKHIEDGHDESLAQDLKSKDCFKTHEERNSKKGVISVKVPENAHQTFSEGEFNRFYIRALCLRSIEEKKQLQVYRGRHSENPRPESEVLIGTVVDPGPLLDDLRLNIGVDTALGLPNGPNSGLTIRLI
jgi:hypothetical protein